MICIPSVDALSCSADSQWMLCNCFGRALGKLNLRHLVPSKAWKQILKDRLAEATKANAGSQAKNRPTPRSKGKENPPVKTVKPVKPGKQPVKKGKGAKRAPSVHWARKNFHVLTDRLLTIIEDNPRYQQAFGFSKLPGTNPTTGGMTLADIHTEVAEQLLLVDLSELELIFTEEDLPKLCSVICNRVSALKKAYCKHREELGQTGQGLVENDQADKIEAKSPLANIWDRIKSKFPWYKRLNKLMGTNPAIDRTAVANSQTVIDTSILDATPASKKTSRRKPVCAACSPSIYESESGLAPNLVYNNDDEGSTSDNNEEKNGSEDNENSSVPGSCSSSPAPAAVSPAHTPVQRKVAPVSKSPSTSTIRGTKQKATIMDQINDMATEDCSQRLKIV
ncbi:hypothetical protein B0H34DRAFT_674202 [Crassisporium funariophilum]|nr:hypothetical protein B0H34DRAFT_674202 [Crassisporium funariophilum]